MLLLPLLTILWLLAVAAWFRKSRVVLLGGLLAVAGLAFGPPSWPIALVVGTPGTKR